MKKYKIACLVSHPIQYQVPLFREISRDSRFDLEVIYCSSKSLNPYLDEGFNRSINWDVPLTEGYKFTILPKIFEIAHQHFFNPFNYGIYSILKNRNFDAIWIHGWSNWTQINAILIAKLLRVKILIRGESGIHLKKPRGINRIFRAAMMFFLKKTIDGFLAIGSNNWKYYLEYGVASKKIFLVPYAVDNQFFLSQSRSKFAESLKLRKKLFKNHEANVILFASKLENRKRAEFLINAYKNLCGRKLLKNLPILLIIGDGPEKLKLEDISKNMDLNIFFLGFKNQTELPLYYSMADIFVLPSTQEPWGLVVNEVMNSNCAVIVSDEVGCASDLILHGETGFVFKADSGQELEDYLFELCSNIKRRQQFSLSAKERIQKWSYKEDISGLYEALESVCVN